MSNVTTEKIVERLRVEAADHIWPDQLALETLELVEKLQAFVRRVAEYEDYTHDDVDEVRILSDLQVSARKLL